MPLRKEKNSHHGIVPTGDGAPFCYRIITLAVAGRPKAKTIGSLRITATMRSQKED